MPPAGRSKGHLSVGSGICRIPGLHAVHLAVWLKRHSSGFNAPPRISASAAASSPFEIALEGRSHRATQPVPERRVGAVAPFAVAVVLLMKGRRDEPLRQPGLVPPAREEFEPAMDIESHDDVAKPERLTRMSRSGSSPVPGTMRSYGALSMWLECLDTSQH